MDDILYEVHHTVVRWCNLKYSIVLGEKCTIHCIGVALFFLLLLLLLVIVYVEFLLQF